MEIVILLAPTLQLGVDYIMLNSSRYNILSFPKGNSRRMVITYTHNIDPFKLRIITHDGQLRGHRFSDIILPDEFTHHRVVMENYKIAKRELTHRTHSEKRK